MYEVRCFDVTKKVEFTRVFWDRKKYNNFINKCRYSKVIKIVSTVDNSKYYD